MNAMPTETSPMMTSYSNSARFGLIVIGDEILSGKRVDKHLPKTIEMLAERGMELSWVRYAGDDPGVLAQQLKETMAGDDVVFSFGGIGGTPDDRTRQCAAEAAGLTLAVHPEGWQILLDRFGEEAAQPRRAMVEFPVGARLIPNPINRIPGFSLGHHHFVPGFPNMAWPMVAWVLDELYAGLHRKGDVVEVAFMVRGVRESDITPLLEQFTAEHPQVRVSCLPRWCPPEFELELGFRGARDAVDRAAAQIRDELDARAWSHEPVQSSER